MADVDQSTEDKRPVGDDNTSANPALTFGENIVGKSFNPSKNPTVDKLKALAAELIDTVEVPNNDFSMRSKLFDAAILATLQAQMLLVKYATLPVPTITITKADDDTQADDGGIAAPSEPTAPTAPGGLEAETPKTPTNDPTAAPAAAGSAAGVANPNAQPQTAPVRQPQPVNA